MTRIRQIAGVLIVLFGGGAIYLSLELSYTAEYGPGPGFFSLWLGVLLIIVAGIDLIKISHRGWEPLPDGFIPDREGRRRILLICGGMIPIPFLLRLIGFPLTILLLSIFVLRSMGRQSWWATVVISLIGSYGLFYLFRQIQVPLPRGLLGF